MKNYYLSLLIDVLPSRPSVNATSSGEPSLVSTLPHHSQTWLPLLFSGSFQLVGFMVALT